MNDVIQKSLLELVSDSMLVVDLEFNIRWAGGLISRISNWTLEDLIGESVLNYVHPDDAALATEAMDGLESTSWDDRPHVEIRIQAKDGSWLWLDIMGFNRDEIGPFDGYVLVVRDATHRRLHTMRLEEAQDRLEALLQTNRDGFVILDRERRISFAGGETSLILGVAPREALGHYLPDLVPETARAELAEKLTSVVDGSESSAVSEFTVTTSDGSTLWAECLIVDQRNTMYVNGVVVTISDISERKHLELSLRKQATQDYLTGLVNRSVLVDRIQRAATQVGENAQKQIAALFFVDIDGFKSINDKYGHSVGDEVLAETAARLNRTMRPGDTVARFGGDEFVILCDRLDVEADATAIAARIRAVLNEPYHLRDLELYVASSIGIAFLDPQATDPLIALRDADAAMYQAKDEGGGKWSLFGEQLRSQTMRRTELIRSLHGIDYDESLDLSFQPVVSFSTGKMEYVETLIRWRSDFGPISPQEFIPLAERSGQITSIGQWILVRALESLLEADHILGDTVCNVSINVSLRQLEDPTFLAFLQKQITEFNLDPHRIILEITESAVIKDIHEITQQLVAIKRLGFRSALDDFGTGTGALTQLRHFPIDIIKLDQTYVQGVIDHERDKVIVRSVIELAHNLGLTCTAEGIETEEQFLALRDLGCDSGQGYFISPPRAFDDFIGYQCDMDDVVALKP